MVDPADNGHEPTDPAELPSAEKIYAITSATMGAFEFLVLLLASACLTLFAGMALYAYETEDFDFDVDKALIIFGSGLGLMLVLVIVSLFPSFTARRLTQALAKVIEAAAEVRSRRGL